MLTMQSAWSLREWERPAIFAVLYVEIVSNVGNGIVSIVAPAAALRPLTSAAIEACPGLESTRWFGAMNLVVGYLLYRCLRNPSALPLLLEALLVGDVIYCGSLIPFVRAYGSLPGVLAPFVLTAIMFAARLSYLLREDWPAAVAAGSSESPTRSLLAAAAPEARGE
jgi:hypothetical protein